MTEDALQPLRQIALDHGEPLTDTWGRTAVTITDNIDLDGISALASESGYIAIARYGSGLVPLRLGIAAPEPADLARLAALATNEREAAEVRAARTPSDVAELLVGHLAEVTVSYERKGWARTGPAFFEALTNNWVEIARDMPRDELHVGDRVVGLAPALDSQRARLPVITPASPRPTGQAGDVWDAVSTIADAAAWCHIGVRTRPTPQGMTIALHNDQDPVVPITVPRAEGGVSLLRWWSGGTDGDREEALRYVLRLVSASSPEVLPNARVVQRLAERQRIALSRDRAAEVFRAIADMNKAMTELLASVASSLSDLVEETTKTASATVLGVLGVLALVARDSGSLPTWLVSVASMAAVVGVVAVVGSRWRRISDNEKSVERLLYRFRSDPLLPNEDLVEAEDVISEFSIASRASHARRDVVILGAVACAVALAGAGWLIARGTGVPQSPTVTTTPTPSPTVGRTGTPTPSIRPTPGPATFTPTASP